MRSFLITGFAIFASFSIHASSDTSILNIITNDGALNKYYNKIEATFVLDKRLGFFPCPKRKEVELKKSGQAHSNELELKSSRPVSWLLCSYKLKRLSAGWDTRVYSWEDDDKILSGKIIPLIINFRESDSDDELSNEIIVPSDVKDFEADVVVRSTKELPIDIVIYE